MDIKTCIMVAKAMPNNQSLLLIGRHGIGKSQVVRQLAAHFHTELVDAGKLGKDVPICDSTRKDGDPRVDSYLIDMRLSQMSEGDMIGLPLLVDGETRFCPPGWFMAACREPRIIFLDEINRATPEVMQAAFQVVLDYQLNGFKLHPDSRVIAAINPDAGGYAVNGMDPALLDRFAVVELEPTVDDWIEWAEGKGAGKGDICTQIVSFVKQHRDFLDPPEGATPGMVYQSRRSWHQLDTALKYAKLDEVTGEENQLLFALSLARVGVEAATSFVDFVKNMDRQVSAEDILERWSAKVEKALEKLGAEKFNIIVDKLGAHCKENDWTPKQVQNVAKLMEIMPGEHMINLWTKIADSGRINNAKNVHKLTMKILLETLRKKSETEKSEAEKAEKPQTQKKSKSK